MQKKFIKEIFDYTKLKYLSISCLDSKSGKCYFIFIVNATSYFFCKKKDFNLAVTYERLHIYVKIHILLVFLMLYKANEGKLLVFVRLAHMIEICSYEWQAGVILIILHNSKSDSQSFTIIISLFITM